MGMSQSTELGIGIGIVSRVRDHRTVYAQLYMGFGEVVGLGALLFIEDRTVSRHYLCRVINLRPYQSPVQPSVSELVQLARERTELQAITEIIRKVIEQVPGSQIARQLQSYTATLQLLGVLRKEEDCRWKLVSVDIPPQPTSLVLRPSPEILEKVIHTESLGDEYMKCGIYMGTLSYERNVKVYLVPKKLCYHVAILAQTGAGKTETAKRLIYGFIKSYSRGKVLVLDPMGQYTGLGLVESGTTPLISKLWSDLGRSDLKITVLVPYASESELKALSEQLSEQVKVPLEEIAVIDVKNPAVLSSEVDFVKEILGSRVLLMNLYLPRLLPLSTLLAIRRGVSAYFSDIVKDIATQYLESGMQQILGENCYDVSMITQLLLGSGDVFNELRKLGYHPQSIASVARDLRIIESTYVSTYYRHTIETALILRILEPRSVTCIDLHRVLQDPEPVITHLLNKIFTVCVTKPTHYIKELSKSLGTELPDLDEVHRPEQGDLLLLIIEEAHRYAPAGEEARESTTLPILRKIATEGRKYGLGLCIISQRPARVDMTVLSQCSTIVALRVTNFYDQEQIQRSCESVIRQDVEMLPDLDIGEALISGLAAPNRKIPLRVKIELLS